MALSVAAMNDNHCRVCPSPGWAEYLQTEVLPAVTRDVDLGHDLTEVGPGPGAATDWLRHRVDRLVAVELEPAAAERLIARFAASNVEVLAGDATALPHADDSFDAAASFTMLHHVPTAALQNRLLAELFRVLRPGGVLVGSDSLATDALHRFHDGDTYNPVDPAGMFVRLQTLGYERITITADHAMTFVAHKPRADAEPRG
jgi:SAM-dependent methyltransferase